jgi:hypothetical protein
MRRKRVIYHMNPMGLYQATWNSPVTNRLLLEGGVTAALNRFPADYNPGVTPNDISISELSTGLTYNARSTYNISDGPRYNQRFALSYVTGSHAFKSGITIEEGRNTIDAFTNGNMTYQFRNGVPVSLVQYATPYVLTSLTKADLAIYAQDRWTTRRLTLSYGVRFDYFDGRVPAQQEAATPNGWVPARSFAEVPNVPQWKDLSPRGGASYDLFGDGSTALKVSLGRYVAKTGTQLATANNPVQTSVNTVTRTWTDTNGNYLPDCDLASRAANRECGPMANQNFGGFNPSTLYAADALSGFGARGSNWDLSAEVQRQLQPRRVGDRRLLPQLVCALSRHRQLAAATLRITARHASRRRSIHGCPGAVPIRSATCTTSCRRSSARLTTWSRNRRTSER